MTQSDVNLASIENSQEDFMDHYLFPTSMGLFSKFQATVDSFKIIMSSWIKVLIQLVYCFLTV